MMWLKSVKVVTWIASIGLVSSAVFLAYIVLFPVDVLSNWELRIPKDNYSLGEKVVIESLYTKNVSTNEASSSQRYIECENDNNISVRYLLNEAIADRPKMESGGTGIVVKIPTTIVEVTLPTECFFSVSIDYDVYPRRAEPEYVRSQAFILRAKPLESKGSEPAAGSASGTSVAPRKVDRPGAKTTPSRQQPTRTVPSSPEKPAQPEEPEATGLRVLPLIDDLLKGVGL